MASRLVLTFAGSTGDSVFSYNHADANVEASDVVTLMQTMITNGSVFLNPPLAIKSAKLVVFNETDIPVSSNS